MTRLAVDLIDLAGFLVATRFLERRGHKVTLAQTGREALAAAAGGRFDAVLMDIDMPEMNGLEAAHAIRAAEMTSGRRVPIIALTTHGRPEDREACLRAGMDDYLAKPVVAGDLWETLERWAGGIPS